MNEGYIIQILANAAGLPCPEAGMFVVKMDNEALEGYGMLHVTKKPPKAMRFATREEAIAYYQRVSVCHPLRADGKPNRPLTAFTVELIHIRMHRQ